MTILVIGLNINHNDESLFTADSDSSVAASPITVVFKMAGFGGGVHLVNAVLLTAVLSATNSCFYASSRMLMSLAQRGHAPKVLGYVTSQGVPVPALLVVLAVSCLSFLATIWGEGVAFRWFINLTGTSALLTWISIAFINLRFRRAWKIQGRDFLDLPFKAPFSPYLAWVAVILGALIFAGQGWAATTYDSDTLAQDIVGVYIGVVLFGGFFIAYWIYHLINFRGLPLFVPALEADFETGAVWKRGEGAIVREQDKEEKMAKERNAKPIARKWYKLLRLGRPL
uniref:AAT family amino acid transporter n=1 Tax=Phaffia rhodozyma TaxID=264483 RepID=A0A1I9Q6Z4_PHARH|nr:AAT family amino acid transporter [Phaffia rhodozyma]